MIKQKISGLQMMQIMFVIRFFAVLTYIPTEIAYSNSTYVFLGLIISEVLVYLLLFTIYRLYQVCYGCKEGVANLQK